MDIIDLFSGGGGLSEGFHEHGFNIVAQVEKDTWACETLKTRGVFHYLESNDDLSLYYEYLNSIESYRDINDKRKIIFKKYPDLEEKLNIEVLNKKFGNPEKDKQATSSKQIIKLIERSLIYNNTTEVSAIIGGPPCQAYSLIGRGRMKQDVDRDGRNFLFYHYLNLVKEFQPKVFVFENVPGLISAKKGKLFEIIQEEFDKIGYKLSSGREDDDKKNVLDFSEYGTYQRRKRLILFGHKSEFKMEYPDFSSYALRISEEMNTKNVLSDLPTLTPGQGYDHKLIRYESEARTSLSEYQKLMRRNSPGILNHKARKLQKQDEKIYSIAIKKASEGKQLNYSDLPASLKTHKNTSSFLDRFKVHRWNELPHTVVAHISKDGHYNIHPDQKQLRSLTVREAARIQGFPDNYYFEGPRTAQFVQVGNAVPPTMSNVVAKAVKEVLNNTKQ
ncbi:DNA cytosine methyltransferase [Pseudalkalibacillus sp. Hm43]|uniref:DNA cytosine methyltransferase n=1 Tax=Pseudalkalibacillus sp. Hm43 TaxID=3450742 RepID=UPI003F4352C2